MNKKDGGETNDGIKSQKHWVETNLTFCWENAFVDDITAEEQTSLEVVWKNFYILLVSTFCLVLLLS